MATYVYAITHADHPLRLQELEGIGKPPLPLRTVTTQGLAAVVSEAPPGLRAKRRDVLAHQAVIERLMRDGATLPMRFGLVGTDDEQVAAALEQQRDAYGERLTELSGHVEFNLKVIRDEDDLLREIMTDSGEIRRLSERSRGPSARHDERVALGEMVAREVAARQEREATELVGRLGASATRTALGEPTGDHFLNASFLIEDAAAAAFSRAVQEEAGRRGDAYTLTLTGPLPPYSFV
ncbi:GvpL/GvpF family gas vesicle protein [Streptomyces sp. NPDC127084]|uniref:GvpL/GvpF family gas vesicle protein n=1 Tax=Streptomyces sp. NPDC127084 TaxID=3347133 RepID=UPI00365F48D4